MSGYHGDRVESTTGIMSVTPRRLNDILTGNSIIYIAITEKVPRIAVHSVRKSVKSIVGWRIAISSKRLKVICSCLFASE